MTGISSKALAFGGVENKYKFNSGTELSSKEFSDGGGLDWYEATYRRYDPQIGRFHQIDPLAESTDNWTPYAFCNNNPILFTDPLGLDTTITINGKGVSFTDSEMNSAVTVTGSRSKSAPGTDNSSTTAASEATVINLGDETITIPNTVTSAQSQMFLGFDYLNPLSTLQNTVVEEPGFLSRLRYGNFYRGDNAFGEHLYRPNFSLVMPELPGDPKNLAGRATSFVNITKRIGRALQGKTNIVRRVGISIAEFESNMAKVSGQVWRSLGNGKVKELLHNGLRYVSRETSSGGEATVEIWKDGNLLQKYRF